ncbi:MAG: dihydroorotate dehydrogenase [Candidatus Thermoplasmatota archaeon]|jgi:dihydroorotate dehydrogenase (NAD+) catalytic subunit|nr:dihydroorotate dehydrogenase [Candidatus Thermoplasmatota archaeon]
MPSIRTKIGPISLENPFMLASGILDENGYTMKRILENGASAVVTKSIGTDERTGYSTPVIVELPYGLINAIGLANPGIDNFGEEIKIALKGNRPVIGSIFGSTPEEFVNLALKMENYGVNAIELNLSCPHVKGFGSEVGSDPDLVEEIIKELKSKINIPVFSKLSPNVTDILSIAKAAERSDALVMINTVRAMSIDIYARKPVLSNKYGGLSGQAIKNIGVRYVYEVKKETGQQIVGVGGIETAEDAVEYIMAGASALQVGTVIHKKGIGVFKELSRELEEFMNHEGYETVSEMTGVALS